MATDPILIKLAESSKDWTDYLALTANLLGPIITAILGIWILRITKKIEHSQWRNQKLIEKRIAVWDEVAPKINDIFCYCTRVGNWKNQSPKDVIGWKREVDKNIHTYRPYFSPAFFNRFMELMDVCFATYQGHGVDAKIKTPLSEHESAHNNWEQEWGNYFYETPSSTKEIRAKYLAFQQQLSAELNVEQK
ncbi:hypothetical protein [Gallionella capsiferriformans]|uniref:Uncharacterized protein n=1 Tax=Gallionella capsiferriformans (strain ES-2) TaxID=395494 RepID=D9SG77_GALCS|nr:hypothetical protein [Gallionella capsiferriformans]ADL55524.1 hypothetical protein Galf_1505 [Gallionella capsiferriformans ES-2]